MLVPLISGSGTYLLKFQQFGGDSLDSTHYSTLHYFINGIDLGSYDSNASGANWTDIAIDVTGKVAGNLAQQHVSWRWDHYGGYDAGAVRNMRIEDTAGNIWWDQYHPVYDNVQVGVSGNPSLGGPPTQQIDPSTGNSVLSSTSFVDHYIGTSSSGSGSQGYGTGNAGTSGPKDCVLGDPVNCLTGNLVESATDMAIPGRGRSLSFSRTYNALDAAATPMLTKSLAYTGSPQSFVVPSGVTAVAVDAWGAQGGDVPDQPDSPGGFGAHVLATLTVTPGETLQINAGGMPAGAGNTHAPEPGGFNGGGASGGSSPGGNRDGAGGGGATDIRRGGTALANRVLVAGGGGGSGGWGYAYSESGSGGVGGNDPAGGGGHSRGDANAGANGGGGGSSAAGGAGGAAAGNNGSAGSLGLGGTGAPGSGSYGGGGGGGGGGYYGGGGGGASSYNGSYGGGGAGGGGGASYVDPSATGVTMTAGLGMGAGSVTLSWTDPTPRSFPLGWGWSSSYTMSLSVSPADGTVTVHQENGASVSFTPAGASYTAQPQVIATLVHNLDGTWTYALPDQTADTFSSSGQLLSETDRNGYLTTLSYTGGQLSSITDPAGRSLTLTYDGAGHIARVADPTARHVDYSYDAAGDLTDVIDVGGGHTVYTYDANHRLLSVRAPRFYGDTTTTPTPITTNVYDPASRVVFQTDPLGQKTTWSYNGSVTTITDTLGKATVETFDLAGNLRSVTRGSGTSSAATWGYLYDANDNLIATADPNGHVTRASWDARGNRLSSMDALGDLATFSYDAMNDPLTAVDPLRVATTMTYDAHGNLDSASTPLVGSSPAVAKITTYTYGDAAHPGDVTSVTDPTNKIWLITYDAYGDVASATDPLGDKTQYCYDTLGRRTAVIAPKGSAAGVTCSSANPAFTTTITPNAFGDPLSITDALGHQTIHTYDANRNVRSTKDALNQTTTFSYDAADRLTRTIRPDTTTQGSGYDADGNLIAQVNGLGVTTTYGYDPLNRAASVTDGLGRATVYGYDGAGNVVSKQDPGGSCAATPKTGCTTMTYDAANELVRKDYSDGTTPSEAFSYDADGRQTDMSVLDANSTHTETTSSYDSLGRLTASQQTDGAGAVSNATLPTAWGLGYGYDLAGHVTSIGLRAYTAGGILSSSFSLSRTFDDAGRMHSVTSWAGKTTTFGYDANSNLTTVAYANGTNATSSYDAADRPTSIVDTAPVIGTFLNLPYSYDANGRIASDNASSSPVAVTQAYGYDPVGRLSSASLTPPPTPASNSWGYDAADRLIQMAHAGQTTTALNYDTADQLTTTTNAAGTTTGTYTYDARGNRVKVVDALGNAAVYAYDQANRLTSYSGPSLTTGLAVGGTYLYQPDGLRADMAWDRAEGLPLILSAGVQGQGMQYYVTGPGGQVVEIDSTLSTITAVSADPAFYLHHDAQGNTRAITDPHGVPLVSYSYDPYGQATLTTLSSSTVSVVNPFLFQGQYVDPLSGFIYLRARYYDPGTGQFLTRDPQVALTLSAYGYAADNPLNGSDPTGLITLGECGGGNIEVLGFLNAGADGCLDKTLDGKQIGFIGTVFGPGGLGNGAAVFGGLYIQVSNATSLDQLRGKFMYASLTLDAEAGVQGVVFWNQDFTTVGFELGIGVGGGANLAGGFSDTGVHLLGGIEGTLARVALDAALPPLAIPDLLNQAERFVHQLQQLGACR